MLTVAQLAPLKNGDPNLYETPVKIVSAINATSQRAGVDRSTSSPAPSPIASPPPSRKNSAGASQDLAGSVTTFGRPIANV